MVNIGDRIFEIEKRFGHLIANIVILDVQEDYFKLLIHLRDGSNLRVAEDWSGKVLSGYSYYWLDSGNNLQIGWDNAPHHKKLKTFPHHKHVGRPSKIEASDVRTLEQVLAFIESNLE